jgi:benzodiazapine receptor
MLKRFQSLFFILLITFSSSFVAGIVTRNNIPGWYENLNRLSFSPPNWIFAPVWTTLYLFMSVAIWIVYDHCKKKEKKFANKILRIYFYHLAINFSWSFIFFQFHQILLAFITILILLFAIYVLMFFYYPRSKVSFYLMIPYAAWSMFAGVLNLGLFLIN